MSILDTYQDAETLYDVLGVPETATIDEIKRAYYTLVRLYPSHRYPDLFTRLTAAGTILMDPGHRGEYDQNRRSGKRVQVLVDQAAAALEQDNQKAHALLRSAITLAPDVPRPRHLFAHLLMKMEEYGMAERQYRWLIKETPRDETLRFKLARALHAQGRLADTEKELLRALRLNPRYHDALMLLSRVYERAERWEWAAEHLERAIANDGTENFADLDAFLRLLTIYLQAGNEEGRVETAERLLAILPPPDGPGDTRSGDRATRKMLAVAKEFFDREKFDVAAGVLGIARRIPEEAVTPPLRDELMTQIALVTLTAEAQHSMDDKLLPGVLKDVFHIKYLDKATDLARSDRLDVVQRTLLGEIQRDPKELVTAIEYIRREYPNLAADQQALLHELNFRANRRLELIGPVEVGPSDPAIMPGTKGTTPAPKADVPKADAPKSDKPEKTDPTQRRRFFDFFRGRRDNESRRDNEAT